MAAAAAGLRFNQLVDAYRQSKVHAVRMRSYFVKRILLMVPTVFGISIVSFLLIHLAPGDPAQLKFGEAERSGNQLLSAQIIAETRALYGLDQPLHVQYFRWLRRIITFDFGESLRDH